MIEAGEGTFAYHGGAVDVARRLFPQAPLPWIDLSTGVNPHAYPLPELDREDWTRLPEAKALFELEAAASFRYGVMAPEIVVAGPGSQALIQAMARLAPKGKVGILGKSYGGHVEAFRAAGREIAEVKWLPDLADFKVAIVVNPNNPDGFISTVDDLLDLHERLDRKRGLLIVDEAFADFDSGETFLQDLPAYGAVVLRSFGKSYGLAGLRLGFAIPGQDFVAPLRAALGPWPVSGPAIAIGTRALSDLDWSDSMGERLGQEKARLDALLTSCGWEIVGGTRLFRLAARPDAAAAFRRLAEAGILTRPLPWAPDQLRFGIPADEKSWARLAAALGG